MIERLCQLDEAPRLRALVRNKHIESAVNVEWAHCRDLDDQPALAAAVRDVDVVIHAAARAHVMNETEADPLEVFRIVNTAGTLALARECAQRGVRRFIFISSIKVNGEGTEAGQPYRADDLPSPVDPYGISKHEAERGLQDLATTTGMEVVIIRPPLLYGPGVKGNFLSMMKALNRGWPLPLGAIQNKRSLAARGNLVDLICTCLNHPAAANQIFLVSDGDDLSTTELLRRTAYALGCGPKLIPVPSVLLEVCAAMLGKRHLIRRLCGSLQVDISKTRALLGWNPPIAVDEALREAARHFLATSFGPQESA